MNHSPKTANALFAALRASVAAASAVFALQAFGTVPRYAVVVDKAPFGPPPPSGAAADDSGAGGGASAASVAGAGLEADGECTLSLVALTRYEGVPAAGFSDSASGRQFLLRIGDTEAGWTLLDLDVEGGCALVADATGSERLLRLAGAATAAQGAPSPNTRYWTVMPNVVAGVAPDGSTRSDSAATAPATAEPPQIAAKRAPATPRLRAESAAPTDSTRLSREEENELRRRATVPPPEGGEPRLSYRLLQSLRAEALRRKADAARAEALAAAQERAREAEEAEALRLAAEREEKALREEEERERREGVVAALGAGYDVEVDFELTASEAATLKDAGWDVPDEALEGD